MTTLHVKDSGALKVFRHLRMTISGGVHAEQGAEQHNNGPLTVVEVAAVNEFGGGRIPARMWLRGWVPQHAKNIVQAIRDEMMLMARRQKYDAQPFADIAEDVVDSLRDQIESGQMQPANAPLTLKNKAPETRPLYEHGQLVDAMRGRLVATSADGTINWKRELG